MIKDKELSYNIEGVDMNVYTLKRCDEVEDCADRLEWLMESNKDKFKMIAEIIELSYLINHEATNSKENSIKNILIRRISNIESKKSIEIIDEFSRIFE